LHISALVGATGEVGGKFTVVYSPSNTKFLEPADKIETSDIPAVVSSTLGLSLNQVSHQCFSLVVE